MPPNDAFLPLSDTLTVFYPTDRPYSLIEAALYLQQLYYNNKSTSYNSISILWKWNIYRVRQFFTDLGITLIYRAADRNKRNKQGYIERIKTEIIKTEESGIKFIFINKLNDISVQSPPKPEPVYKAENPADFLMESDNGQESDTRKQLILKLNQIGCSNAVVGDIGFNLPEEELIYIIDRALIWKQTALNKKKQFKADAAVYYIIKEIKPGTFQSVKKVKQIILDNKTESDNNMISLEKFIEVILDSVEKADDFSSFIHQLKTEYPDISTSLNRFPLILEPHHHTSIQLKSIYQNKYLPLIKKDEQQ